MRPPILPSALPPYPRRRLARCREATPPLDIRSRRPPQSPEVRCPPRPCAASSAHGRVVIQSVSSSTSRQPGKCHCPNLVGKTARNCSEHGNVSRFPKYHMCASHNPAPAAFPFPCTPSVHLRRIPSTHMPTFTRPPCPLFTSHHPAFLSPPPLCSTAPPPHPPPLLPPPPPPPPRPAHLARDHRQPRLRRGRVGQRLLHRRRRRAARPEPHDGPPPPRQPPPALFLAPVGKPVAHRLRPPPRVGGAQQRAEPGARVAGHEPVPPGAAWLGAVPLADGGEAFVVDGSVGGGGRRPSVRGAGGLR